VEGGRAGQLTSDLDDIRSIDEIDITDTILNTALDTQVDEGATLGEMAGFLTELGVEGLGADRIDPGLARARIKLDGNSLARSSNGNVDGVDGAAELVIKDGIRLSLANIPDQRRA
jgi:hypothetical protein